jgi:hypothetical protein
MGSKQVVQSGTKDTAAARLPAIQTAIQTGANTIVIAGNDPALCPQLKQARPSIVVRSARHELRQLFINQAEPRPSVAKQIRARQEWATGRVRDPLGRLPATNQNAWIKFMKRLKLPSTRHELVKIYYGNDDPKDCCRPRRACSRLPDSRASGRRRRWASSAAQYLSTRSTRRRS